VSERHTPAFLLMQLQLLYHCILIKLHVYSPVRKERSCDDRHKYSLIFGTLKVQTYRSSTFTFWAIRTYFKEIRSKIQILQSCHWH